MANAPTEIRSFLKDISLSGAGSVPKKKLLWMLGWAQDRRNAWGELLDYWVEIGEDRKTLVGCEAGDVIVLTKSPGRFYAVSDWAQGL